MMDIAVTSDKEEKLYSRRSIAFSMTYDKSTPSKEQARTELCKRLNLMPDLTIITDIVQDYGTRTCTAHANSYASKDALQRFERRHVLSRLSKKEGGEKGEEKGEAKKDEKKGEAEKDGKKGDKKEE